MKTFVKLIFLQILLTGCGFDNTPEFSKAPYELSDIHGPTVIMVNPLPDLKDVPIDTLIMVEFSEAILPESVNELSFYLESKTERISGTYIFNDDNKKAFFIPVKYLEPLTQYTITLNNRITDPAGNELVDQEPNDKLASTPFVSVFTTGAVENDE